MTLLAARSDGQVRHAVGVEAVHDLGADVELDHACPGLDVGQFVAILLGLDPDHGRLEPQRQVLRHEHRIDALVRQVPRHGEDPVVIGRRAEGLGQARSVDVVELDADRAPSIVDGDRIGQRSVGDPKSLEASERFPSGPTQLGMEAFRLQFREDHERDDHVVFLELLQCHRVRQQHRRVEDEGALIDAPTVLPSGGVVGVSGPRRGERSVNDQPPSPGVTVAYDPVRAWCGGPVSDDRPDETERTSDDSADLPGESPANEGTPRFVVPDPTAPPGGEPTAFVTPARPVPSEPTEVIPPIETPPPYRPPAPPPPSWTPPAQPTQPYGGQPYPPYGGQNYGAPPESPPQAPPTTPPYAAGLAYQAPSGAQPPYGPAAAAPPSSTPAKPRRRTRWVVATVVVIVLLVAGAVVALVATRDDGLTATIDRCRIDADGTLTASGSLTGGDDDSARVSDHLRRRGNGQHRRPRHCRRSTHERIRTMGGDRVDLRRGRPTGDLHGDQRRPRLTNRHI